MQCSSCHVKRCSTEFPGTTLSETCEHPPTICLSCLRKLQSNLESLSHCPQCWEPLATADCQKLQAAIRHCDRACAAFEDLDILKEREQKAKEEANLDPMGLVGTRTGEIEVTVLDGRRCKLSLSKQMRLSEVMKQIQEKLGVPPGQQRLLFRGREISENTEEEDPLWGTLAVPFGEALQLVVIMYQTGRASSGTVRSLQFELRWTAQHVTLRNGKNTIHHLNGSCLVLNGRGMLLTVVDFQKQSYPGIRHGGPSSRISPRQSLSVDVGLLPSDCRYLFFTLSGFMPGGVSLAIFQDPSVHLRDAATHRALASYTADRCRSGEAVVLCCASKNQLTGQWSVQQIGKGSSGNKSNYEPLYHTVQALVNAGQVM
ncbi:unnamed protein product [Durusdinium trenchii]|uniref:Ubiquitin-like domain-containing protein n=1 Tax=Durusdinium trenchii TaxID=1381693 RepID=A0ABP0SED4_9DINO